MKNKLQREFRAKFASSGEPLVVWAPGRVNLLGEHTDYNDGFVFPMAIDAGIAMAGALNKSDRVNLYSLNYDVQDSFALQDIVPSDKKNWSNYIRGVCREFQSAGFEPQGMDIVIYGNVPQGAGLSSSAALEVAAAVLLTTLHDFAVDSVSLIKMAQRAENDFVGVASGIMDQFASMMGHKDHALFLDCRSLDYDLVPTPFEQHGYAVAVINSGVRRGLVDSAYNDRRQECMDAVRLLTKDLPKITALRDVTVEDLPLVNALPQLLAKRARHVVTENNRVLSGIEALRAGDLVTFGQELTKSHRSLQNDFEVSCPELDLLVDLSLGQPGVLGARMTGAGFGGCAIALVPRERLAEFEQRVTADYAAKTNLTAEVYVFGASHGAMLLS